MTRQSWFVTLTAASTVLLALLLFAFLREGPPVPGASAPSDHLRVISPAPPRPVPDDLVTAHEEIVRLQRAEEFEKAAEEYYALLRHLAGRWGESNPDLAPYYYNFAYILKSAGRVTDCEGVLLAARDKWPDSLQLQLFDATLRAEVSLAIGRLDPELDGLFATLLRDDNLPRIRGLRVDPMVLFAQRAELLLRADRRVDATRVVDRALGIDGSDLALRRLRARLLLANQKAAAARALCSATARPSATVAPRRLAADSASAAASSSQHPRRASSAPWPCTPRSPSPMRPFAPLAICVGRWGP